MKTALAWIVGANAALFLFGAVQHIGVALGPFREPRIMPAAVVEAACGVVLTFALAALFRHSVRARKWIAISNVIALVGVLIGLIALAIGAGPRTASNDIYHRLMLVLIVSAFTLLYVSRARTRTPA
jgi:hypothetical protein